MSTVPTTAPAGANAACWNRIGIRGDKSCPALGTYSHCRNCPTFARAAADLFDAPADPAAALEAAEALAQPSDTSRHTDRSAIRFRIGREWFALATGAFDEVVSPRVIHTLPHKRTPVLLGLVNVRGDLVICLSLARLMALEADEAPSRSARLLVLRGPSGRCAVPVDEVQHTCRYHDSQLMAPPATVARGASAFTAGLLPDGERMLSSLDAASLFDALDRCLA
jgi:chemotaxis-related protein WspD